MFVLSDNVFFPVLAFEINICFLVQDSILAFGTDKCGGDENDDRREIVNLASNLAFVWPTQHFHTIYEDLEHYC